MNGSLEETVVDRESESINRFEYEADYVLRTSNVRVTDNVAFVYFKIILIYSANKLFIL